MTEQELQYILTIAEERNITHAAQRLHIAQPSLTQCLRRIETELGVKLFTRRKYGLDPTDAGELYIGMARDVIERIHKFRDDLRKMTDPMTGELSVGASWYNTLIYFSDFVPRFHSAYPGVQIRLEEKRTAELLDLLRGHEIDLIIAHEYPREYPGKQTTFAKDICRVLLEDEPFCLLGHVRLFEEAGIPAEGTADLAGFRNQPFIFFNSNQRVRRITDFTFKNANIFPKGALSTQSFPGALDFASRGLGFVILPKKYIDLNISRHPELASLSLDPALHAYWSNCLYYRENELHDPLVKEALRILAESAVKK